VLIAPTLRTSLETYAVTMHMLLASSTSDSNVTERRVSPRYPLVQRCFVRPDGATGQEDWRGIVYNISLEGVGVALPYQMLPGAILLVKPAGLKNAPAVRGKVVHTRIVEYLWFHGCELLEPLDAAGLHAWLGAR
jgi:hypothetical protein